MKRKTDLQEAMLIFSEYENTTQLMSRRNRYLIRAFAGDW